MVTKTEGRYAGEFIITEANGYRSRKDVYITAGDLSAGAVLGRAVVAAAGAGNTGASTIGSVTMDPALPDGVYTITATSTGATAAFTVTGPNAEAFGTGAVGTAFSAGGVAFTITDGTPDTATGDTFTITVSHIELDPSGTDGEDVAAAILYDAVDASAAAVWGAAVVADAEVMKDALQWNVAVTAAQKLTAYTELFDLGIRVIDAA